MVVSLAVSTQYTNVTDRQTDSQPPHDSIGRAMYRIALQKGPLNDGPSLCCPSPGLLQRAVLRRHRRTDALPAVSSERCRTAHRVQDCDSRPPALVRQRPGLPGLSPTPVSDNRVLPTLEHSLSVGRATFLELDICRSRTTSLEQFAAQSHDYVGRHTASSGGY